MSHSNSAAAHTTEQTSGRLSKRAQRIITTIMWKAPQMTDRQIRDAMGLTDMNSVRPRITELIKSGQLEECGSIIDPETSKRVRLVRLKQGQQRLFYATWGA